MKAVLELKPLHSELYPAEGLREQTLGHLITTELANGATVQEIAERHGWPETKVAEYEDRDLLIDVLGPTVARIKLADLEGLSWTQARIALDVLLTAQFDGYAPYQVERMTKTWEPTVRRNRERRNRFTGLLERTSCRARK